MGEFSDLVGIRNDYYEYTDEICEIIKGETTAINEAYLADAIVTKLINSLDNEYPLTNMIVLRMTHNEIIEIITDSSKVNIRRDINDKIVSRVTGMSAIKTYYCSDKEQIKRRRAMMNMISNYMHSMYLNPSPTTQPLMEEGIRKALQSFREREDSIKEIDVTSFDTRNPIQGIIFTITIHVEAK